MIERILVTTGALAACCSAQEPTAEGGGLRATIVPERSVAAHRIADLGGEGRDAILLVGEDGAVEVWSQGENDEHPMRRESGLVLGRPLHSVMALADVTRDGRDELVVYDDRGVRAFALGTGGGFETEPLTLVERSRLRIRVGAPTFADIVKDLNGDGLPDLVLPVFGECEIWLQRPLAEASSNSGEHHGAPQFELAQTVGVPVAHKIHDRVTNLAEPLINKVRVPRLDIADVNGDGRPDLRTREGEVRRFYLQGEDGRFAEKAIEVDLSMFRDTTPEPDVRLGETFVLEDEQQMQAGDLNADSIPDYVIAHRRKVWSFLASEEGPQFQRADVRVVAEDVSGLLLMHLDDDDRSDLFIFKIDAPTAAELLLGLVGSIDVPIHCLGYRTGEDGTFERRAAWKRTLTLRVPSITRLLSEAGNLVEEFMTVLSKLRWSTVADFDGDGRRDLALITEDEKAIELWISPATGPADGREIDAWLRDILFEDPDTVFDVERLLKLAAQVFDARTSSMTGGRRPDAQLDLPPRERATIVGLLDGDLDGDGAAEVIVVTEPDDAPGMRRFDVLGWR